MKYRDRLYANYSSNFGERKSFDPTVQFAVYEKIYRNLPKNTASKIGDLGCGKGEWLAWLHEKGFSELTGIDVAASEVDFTSEKDIRMVNGDILEKLAETEGKFDLLHAKDVLEHLTKNEAVDFLDACHKALRPGGELWILTYNAQSPLSNATRHGDFTHELGVTPVSLGQLLQATGFEVTEVGGYFPRTGSVRGAIRAGLFWIVEKFASLILKLRHGVIHGDPAIDTNTAKPDLFSVAKRPH
ncbi:MAG: methyltransferase domain-containing protein [Verrucomicrobiales bacterium]|nr:methyltransferase domain-containing protein [Verrucomicrobiales bacterium]